MKRDRFWTIGPGIRVVEATLHREQWVVEAVSQDRPACPGCGTVSTSRHSSYSRCLQDLPVQGMPVMLRLRVGRWRCRNSACSQRVFTERMPAVVAPFAQRTRRVTDLVRLIGHSAGGRPAERLMQRFGISVSDDTILRHLKQAVKDCGAQPPPRVIGIDDWAWRKGQSYGTILVDLERGTVLDVLEARSASSAAAWLDQHPSVQIVSRDRCGLYAEAVRRGAPQARQVADRFHLIQNLREAIEKQLSHFKQSVQVPPSTTFGPTTLNVDAIPATGDQQRLARQARWVRRQQMFAQVKSLQEAGHTAADIVREMGLSRKRVDKWIRLRDERPHWQDTRPAFVPGTPCLPASLAGTRRYVLPEPGLAPRAATPNRVTDAPPSPRQQRRRGPARRPRLSVRAV